MKEKEKKYRIKIKHIQIINDFYSSLLSTNEYKKVAMLGVKALMKYSNSPSVAVYEYDKNAKKLFLVASKGFDSAIINHSKVFDVNKSITGVAVKTKKLLAVKDITNDKRVDDAARKVLLKGGFKSVISVPLIYGKNVLGSANLIFQKENVLRDIDNETLIAIGKTFALAMANSRYINNIKQEVKKRKEAEIELIQSEKKYKHLVENLNDMIVKFNKDGRLKYVSPNYCQIFGIEEKKLLGKKYLPPIHPEDYPKVKDNLKRALKFPFSCKHEERMLTVYGWRWIQWSNKAIESDGEDSVEIIAIGRDITEQKEAEFNLIESKNNLKSILEAIPDVLFKINKKGFYLDYFVPENSSLKISKDLILGKNISQTLPETVYKAAVKKIKSVVSTGLPEIMEYSMPHLDKVRHYEGRLVKSGKEEVLVIVRDITDIKEYRDEINKLALIARETDNGVLITDTNDRIEWVNEGFTRITGYTLDEVKNKRPGDFLLGQDSNLEVAEKFADSLYKGKKTKAEILNYDKHRNTFWVELNAQAVFDKVGNIKRYIYLQNVTTQRKEYELMLKEKQERLSELTQHLISIRESERADIARGIHDELGQIVAAVKMNLTFLINSLSSYDQIMPQNEILDELKSMSKMIDKSVISIRRLIKNLRPETLDKLGLTAALKQLLEDFKQLTKINYRFTKNFDELNLDGNKSIAVYRTVQESLTNIIKHSGATKVSVDLKNKNKKLLLSITDNGKGIKQEDLQKSQSFGLLGMRQRIEGLGGLFNITGKDGSGTKLNLVIPIEVIN